MTRRILIAILALAAVPVLAQSASAHGRHGSAYEYRGTVTALTGDQLQVQVTGGNRPATFALTFFAQKQNIVPRQKRKADFGDDRVFVSHDSRKQFGAACQHCLKI